MDRRSVGGISCSVAGSDVLQCRATSEYVSRDRTQVLQKAMTAVQRTGRLMKRGAVEG
jgi:hypothetical protein